MFPPILMITVDDNDSPRVPTREGSRVVFDYPSCWQDDPGEDK